MTRWGQRVRASWSAWWQVVLLAAQILVLAVLPSSYRRGEQRHAVLLNLYQATGPLLTWFLVLSALISVVLIRIVVATAYSYGLSQYALEVLVRTLVLELIPLYAALFVALRYAMPSAQRVRRLLAAQQQQGIEHANQVLLRAELLPRALAAVFSVLLLAAISCVVALVLAYLGVYGFNMAGLPSYTRMFGQVFSPSVTMVFVLKTLFFSLAVALIPMAAGLYDTGERAQPDSELGGLARMFAVLLLIEVGSLVGNYY